jgi:Circadian oscillating protein COP23
MKKRLLAQAFLGSTVAVVASLASVSPSQAQGQTNFVCSRSGGVPATVAQTPYGNVTIIKWVSGYFTEAGFDPQTRCQKVSERFQRYHESGKMDYLTTGWINRQSVVCVANSRGGNCASDLAEEGLLFTLKPSSDPGDTLRNLLSVRVRATSTPLSENLRERQVYVDMKCLLKANGVSAEYEKCSSGQPSLQSPSSQSNVVPLTQPSRVSPAQPTSLSPASSNEPVW